MRGDELSEYAEIVSIAAIVLGLKPPECLKEVVKIFLQEYISGNGAPVTLTRNDVVSALEKIGFRASYNQVKDALNCLIELNFLENPVAVYKVPYRFPRKTLRDSIYSPVNAIIEKIGDYRDIAAKLIREIERRIGTTDAPVIPVDRKGFYEECIRVIDRYENVLIFSHTPGIILCTERRDPTNPLREFYFNRMRQKLESGSLRVKYMFDLRTTKEIVRKWVKNKEIGNIRSSIELCRSESEFLNNPRIRNLEVRAIEDSHLPGMVIGDDIVIVGVKDHRALDPDHAVRGEVIRAPNLVEHFREAFLREWKEAKVVGSDVIERLLEEIENEMRGLPEGSECSEKIRSESLWQKDTTA
ncbi:hypothetical protein [Archaeoglobus sp.]